MDFKHEGMAEWDQRQAYHQRLHEAILHAHRCMYANDYQGWYKALTVLEIELSSHVRGEEEETLVKNSMNKVKTIINSTHSPNNPFTVFIDAQKAMHYIMRKRGFDVPVQEYSPGSALRQ